MHKYDIDPRRERGWPRPVLTLCLVAAASLPVRGAEDVSGDGRYLDPSPDLVIELLLLMPEHAKENDTVRGVRFGAEEAGVTANLLGKELRLRSELVGSAAEAVEHVRRTPPQAVLSMLSAAQTDSLAAALSDVNVVMVPLATPADSLPASRCLPQVLHLLPSGAMRRDAVDAASTAAGAEVVVWDAELDRYGAEQLSARYRGRYDAPMSSEAWTGWLTVKAIAEAALRGRARDGAEIAGYLRGDRVGLDGHKGRALSFRAWDGQLRQPLYVRGADGLIEVPKQRPGSDTDTRTLLDTLGDTAAESPCASQRAR